LQLAETQSEGKDLDEWVLEKYHEYPLVLLLPTGKGKLMPFHHLVRDTENHAWVGLGGLGGGRSIHSVAIPQAQAARGRENPGRLQACKGSGGDEATGSQAVSCLRQRHHRSYASPHRGTDRGVREYRRRIEGDIGDPSGEATYARTSHTSPSTQKPGTQVKVFDILATLLMWMANLSKRQQAAVPPAREGRFQNL
jgi:hypothetical protein